MPDLSIILPTCNRAELLERSLHSLHAGTSCSFELIVIDGGSVDRTPQVLQKAQKIFGNRLRVIREKSRRGFVHAANLGFRAATGRNMLWLNDDVRPRRGALDLAVAQIDDSGAAFLAMFHQSSSTRNVAFEALSDGNVYRLLHVRGTLYANFPIGRRETFAKLGYFDEGFYFYGGDPDLSLKAWAAGMRVEPAWGVFLDHDEAADDRRSTDLARADDDNRRLFAKWDLPPKNLARNDFDPMRPCTLRGLRARDNPSVSFVLATYNRREVVLQTLGQLRDAQAASGISCETIVVDNGSGDGSGGAIAGQFPEVRLLRERNNRGPCAKNLGIAQARGEFIVFLDDDAHPTAESIGNMVRHFQRDAQLRAASFDAILPDGSHECSAYPSVFIGCGVGFRATALAQAGGLPDDFFMAAEEYDLSFRLLNTGWKVQRFEDLRVLHRKAPGSRFPTRITRLDVRNNLCLIARHFPRKWMLPFAVAWMRRYRWIAQSKGRGTVRAFWVGLAEGIWRSRRRDLRSAVSPEVFEQFAMLRKTRNWMRDEVLGRGHRRIVLLDVGKNILAFVLAAEANGIEIAAIADPRLARPGRRFRGISVIDDAEAKKLAFDAAVIANTSPVHAALRREDWRGNDGRPVFDLFQPAEAPALAA